MMNTVMIGDKLTLSYPDGFHIMDSVEKSNMQFFDGSTGECLSDPERHILISIGAKPIGGIFSFLVNAKDAAKKMEASIRKPMQKYGYLLNRFAEKSVGGKKAEGFSYEYASQGTDMYGESYVIKYDRKLYYLNLYAHRELLSESLDIWNMVLSSAKWA